MPIFHVNHDSGALECPVRWGPARSRCGAWWRPRKPTSDRMSPWAQIAALAERLTADGDAAVDGAEGYPAGAPYDRIIATCAVRAIPTAWLKQAMPGTVLLADVHGRLGGTLVRLIVDTEGTATGRFLPRWAGLMWMRQSVDPNIPPVHVWDDDEPTRSATDVDSSPLPRDGELLGFLAQWHLPGTHAVWEPARTARRRCACGPRTAHRPSSKPARRTADTASPSLGPSGSGTPSNRSTSSGKTSASPATNDSASPQQKLSSMSGSTTPTVHTVGRSAQSELASVAGAPGWRHQFPSAVCQVVASGSSSAGVGAELGEVIAQGGQGGDARSGRWASSAFRERARPITVTVRGAPSIPNMPGSSGCARWGRSRRAPGPG
jgi:protein-L-isoaspartate(D-aspartate) O-methyltransferase (PCMT)